MSRKTDAVVAHTIGIDTGKNTLHLIGLKKYYDALQQGENDVLQIGGVKGDA